VTPRRPSPQLARLLVPLLAAALSLPAGCARYSPDQNVEIGSKNFRKNGEGEGVARVLDREQIKRLLDYDVEAKRLVPVSAMIRNRGGHTLRLDYLRTRIVDGNLSYGLVPVEVAILRTERTGFWKAQLWMRVAGLLGYMYHKHQINKTNEKLREDFEWQALPDKPIVPNATLRGMLFFQIDPASARNFDPARYDVVISLVSTGNPPIIELRFPPE